MSLVDGLSAVTALTRIPLENVDESGLLLQALEALMLHQDMGHCSLFLNQSGRLVCAARLDRCAGLGRGQDDSSMESVSELTVGEGLLGLACQSGTPQYCRNAAIDPQYAIYRGRQLFHDAGSLMALPLGDSGGAIGVLCVANRVPEFFEAWHQHFLILFANLLARLLTGHRMLNRLEHLVSQRTLELESALHESEILRERYRRLSTTDELSGLHNRRFFFEQGAAMLARALRYGEACSLLLLDLDHLKRINDRYGHAMGDRVLQQVAEVLQAGVRAGDLLARLGGEEFVLLLPRDDLEGARMMAQRMRDRVSLMVVEQGDQAVDGVTVSIGIAHLPGGQPGQQPGPSPAGLLDGLYREADLALYRCKAQGRDRIGVFTGALQP